MSFRANPIRALAVDEHAKLVKNLCQDRYAIEEAKKLVPIDQLLQTTKHLADKTHDSNYQHDKLIQPLVEWFANHFFTWFDPPECDHCCSNSKFTKSYVNKENKVVEVFQCDKDNCTYKYEFIRHNDPSILLSTRRGRCGEWANCFFVFLKALDYEARIVFDSTDHVWNEVWSVDQQRWLHVDPCEQVIDEPLIYEIGWSKKLEYCIAYGQHEVLDVTRRYTCRYDEVRSRRMICDDVWLDDFLQDTTERMMACMSSDDDRIKLIERRLLDISYLESLQDNPRRIFDRTKFVGRKTGSIQWRIDRGEYNPKSEKHVVIKITKPGVKSQMIFSIEYNCDKNSYRSSQPEYCSSNWSSLVYRYLNLDYKYERDWKTSYVARYETCPHDQPGEIEWRFDLSNLDREWQYLEVKICGKTYPNTTLKSCLMYLADCDGTEALESLELELNEITRITVDKLHANTKVISLQAKLTGGSVDDQVAWQKPQLFRQTKGLNSSDPILVFRICR